MLLQVPPEDVSVRWARETRALWNHKLLWKSHFVWARYLDLIVMIFRELVLSLSLVLREHFQVSDFASHRHVQMPTISLSMLSHSHFSLINHCDISFSKVSVCLLAISFQCHSVAAFSPSVLARDGAKVLPWSLCDCVYLSALMMSLLP